MPLGTKKSTYHKVQLEEEEDDDEEEDLERAAEPREQDEDGGLREPAGAAGAPAGVLGRLRAGLPELPGLPGIGGAPSLGPCVNLKDSRHPWVAFFHVFFKAAALAVYLLGTADRRHPCQLDRWDIPCKLYGRC